MDTTATEATKANKAAKAITFTNAELDVLIGALACADNTMHISDSKGAKALEELEDGIRDKIFDAYTQ